MNQLKNSTLSAAVIVSMITSMISSAVSPSMAWAEDPCQNEEAWGRQKAAYCAAAKSAEEAKKGQETVGFVQAGVAAVCLAVCAQGATGFQITGNYCTVASIAGTAATFMTTKNTAAKMTSTLGTAVNLFAPRTNYMQARNDYINQTGNTARSAEVAKINESRFVNSDGTIQTGVKAADYEAVKSNPSSQQGFTSEQTDQVAKAGAAAERDAIISGKADKAATEKVNESERGMACFTAAIAAMSSFMSFDGAKDSKRAAAEAREAAAELATEQTTTGESRIEGDLPGAGQEKLGANGDTSKGSPFMAQSKAGSSKGASSKPSGFNAIVSAALAVPNNGLPPAVASPEFRKALEKLSGRSADELARIQDTQGIMQASLGRTLSSKGQSVLAQILGESKVSLQRELATLAPSQLANASYMPSRLGTGMSAGQGQLFEQAQTEEARKPASAGGSTEGDRVLASVLGDEENPEISLFSRVSTRLQVSKDRVISAQF